MLVLTSRLDLSIMIGDNTRECYALLGTDRSCRPLAAQHFNSSAYISHHPTLF